MKKPKTQDDIKKEIGASPAKETKETQVDNDNLNMFGGVLLNEHSRQFVAKVASGVTKVSFVMGICLAGSIALNGYFAYQITNIKPEYFASTENGRIIPLIPLSEPVMSVADVIDFAQKSVRRSMTLDFLNFRSQLEDSRQYYTSDGFQSFIGSMSDSGILDTIRNGRYNMSTSTETGVLSRQGLIDGRRVYVVSFPIQVKLSGQTNEKPDQKFLATVRVERISTAIDTEGVAITQVVTEPR